MIFYRACTTCHIPTPTDATFCPHCGASFVPPVASEGVEHLPEFQEWLAATDSEPNAVDDSPDVKGNTDPWLPNVGLIMHPVVRLGDETPTATAPPDRITLQLRAEAAPTAFLEPIPDFGRSRARAAWFAATFSIALLVAAAVTFGLSLSSSAEAVSEPPLVALDAPAPSAAPIDAPLFDFHVDDSRGSIEVDGRELHTVRTWQLSRYGSISERTEAIAVRLNHVARQFESTGVPPRFEAVRTAAGWEVAWQRPEGGGFRILDVTSADVKAYRASAADKISNRDLAILQADLLTAAFEPHVPRS